MTDLRQYKILKLRWKRCSDTGQDYAQELLDETIVGYEQARDYAATQNANNEDSDVEYIVEAS